MDQCLKGCVTTGDTRVSKLKSKYALKTYIIKISCINIFWAMKPGQFFIEVENKEALGAYLVQYVFQLVCISD